MSPGDQAAAYERQFRRAGLPMFVEGFSASTGVFNRAAPLLGLVFLAELLGAGQLDWTWWQNLLALAGALCVLLAGMVAINLVAGRPARAIPNRIGKTELAAFVLLPALLPLIFGGQLGSAAATAAVNLLILALIYAVFVYGLLAIVRWVLMRLAGQLAGSLGLIAKAITLLAIFALLSFTSTEVWQVFADPSLFAYFCTLALFVILGTVFLIVRVPREAAAIELDACPDGPPLSRRQRINVGLVLFVSQALQVLFVSLAIGLFFVLFGMLAIDDAVRASWLGDSGNEIFSVSVGGDTFELTEELLRVAGGLAAFSGFYFAVAMLTDTTYRDEFLSALTGEMRASFRARVEYLRVRRAAA